MIKINTFPLYFIIPFALLFGCRNNDHKQTAFNSHVNEKTLTDSLEYYESLVNATKISDNKSSRLYAKRSFAIALQLNSESYFARAYLLLGISFNNQDIDTSYFYYTKALKISNRKHLSRLRAKILYNLSMIYRQASDLKMAMGYLDTVIELTREDHYYEMASNAYNALGNIHYDLHDSVKARSSFDSALQIALKYNLQKQIGVALASRSRLMKSSDSSKMEKMKALRILQMEKGNEEEIASILINLGARCSNPDTAIVFYNSAIHIAQSGNLTLLKLAAYNDLAYGLLDKGENLLAEHSLIDQAIPIALKDGNLDWLSTLYDSYSDVLIAQKKTDKALLYEQKALRTRALADKKQAKNQVRLLAAILDTKNRELRIQEKEKEVKANQSRIQLLIIWLGVSLLALLISLFIFIFRTQRNRIRYQREMLGTAKKLIELEENLKGRVSMELHDLTTPFYTTMIRQIEKAKIKDENVESELKKQVSAMAASIREISHSMNNKFLQQLTITELIEGLCKDLQASSSLSIRCVIGEGNYNLTNEETIHLYRIVQELLTNGLKYVPSGEIKITLSDEAGKVFIFYEDKGPGFDAAIERKKGLGISNIEQRAKIIKGKAVLTTSGNKGTKWEINVPSNHSS